MSGLISKQKVIKKIEELPNSPNGYSATYDKASIIMAIEDIEPVELVHAHWIENKTFEEHRIMLMCSRCTATFNMDKPKKIMYRYCPHCGAKMDEEMN